MTWLRVVIKPDRARDGEHAGTNADAREQQQVSFEMSVLHGVRNGLLRVMPASSPGPSDLRIKVAADRAAGR